MSAFSSMQKIAGIASSFLLLTACQTPATYAPEVTPEELQAERDYQQRMMEKVKAQGGMPETWHRKKGAQAQFERVAERIEKAGADLCRETGLPAQGRKCYYYFHLASTNGGIGAHADGTSIVIQMGMMRFVANDDELALVMAHELTHNLMRHGDAKNTNALVGQMMGAMLDAAVQSQGVYGMGMAEAAHSVGRIGYSAAFEREADYMGAYIAARAGYNVRNGSDFWRRLSYQEPDSFNGGLTHPANPERFVSLNKTVTEIEYKRKNHDALVPNIKPQT